MGEIIASPFEVKHTKHDVDELIKTIQGLEGETKIVMESTGRYPLPLLTKLSDAGFFVSMVNAKLIKDYNPDNTLRKVKSDPADSRKIARYAIDNWAELRKYSIMDATRTQLKTLNAQMDFFTKQKAAAKLIRNLTKDLPACK